MKLIENSVDIEHLQSSVSYAELEVEMTSCDIVHANGPQINKENLSEKELSKTTKLTNGVNTSPAKQNGVNGFLNYEMPDDDYQLVLESSSDEGGSPAKKDDDDVKSQIVQEITDLLGLDSSSARIEEELNDSEPLIAYTNEKGDINITSEAITSNIPQEIQDAFEDKEDITGFEKENINIINESKEEKEEVLTVCNASSVMNVVFDEVEIGMDTKEALEENSFTDVSLQNTELNASNPLITSDEIYQTKMEGSSKEEGSSKQVDSVTSGLPDKELTANSEDKKVNALDCVKSNFETSVENEIPLTQLSNTSDSSTEWTVIDSISESEDDLSQKLLTDKNAIEPSNKDTNIYNEQHDEVVEKKNIVKVSTQVVEKKNNVKVSAHSEEEESRKRTASINEEEIILKKPKLEEVENNNSSHKVKRSSSEPEQEAKRTKRCDTVTEAVQAVNPVQDKDFVNEELKIKLYGGCNKDVNIINGKDMVKVDSNGDNKLVNHDKKKENSCDIYEVKTEDLIKCVNTENGPSKLISETSSSKIDGGQETMEVESAPEIICENAKFETNSMNESAPVENYEESIKRSNIPQEENDHCVTASSIIDEITISPKNGNLAENGINGSLESVDDLALPKKDDKILKMEKNENSVTVYSSIDGENISSRKDSRADYDISKKGTFKSMDDESVYVKNTNQLDGKCSTTDDNEELKKILCLKPLKKEMSKQIVKELQVIKQNASELVVSPNTPKEKRKSPKEANQGNVDVLTINIDKGNVKTDNTAVLKSFEKVESSIIEKINGIMGEINTFKDGHMNEDNKNKSKANSLNKEVHIPTKQVNIDSELSSKKENIDLSVKIKDGEISKTSVNSKQEYSNKGLKDLLTTHTPIKKPEIKQTLSKLDKSIESVVEKARSDTERGLPVLKRFHKDQLKKLTRSDLEETIVMKICEAVTDRSEIGQMRLRCQSLEQNCDMWRKKAMHLDKQNRELEMVLKRFLTETAQIKKDNLNKVALPIRVTRSVGLQVVLESSSMQGALIPSKNKVNPESSTTDKQRQLNQQQQLAQQHLNQLQPAKTTRIEKDTAKEKLKATVFNPPVQPKRQGRPPKASSSLSTSSKASPAQQPVPSKVILLPPSPVKQPVQNKQITTPTKDLEVIDLTDREEKSKSLPQSSSGGPIRIAPSTQVCFMQNTPSPSTSQTQMAYLVQKPGQRQQYLVTTSSPSPTRPADSQHRPPPALAVPVFRAGGQIIPAQSNTLAGVRTTPSNVTNTSRQAPQAIRVSPPTLKHPAPLPPQPAIAFMTGLKSAPPKPQLKIAKTPNGIMLSWSMSLTKDLGEMASYQLYAYQEGSLPPSSNLWKKVGDVRALPLPMACTLTQFMEGNKYHFAVRAVDVHGRVGPFSSPGSILLTS